MFYFLLYQYKHIFNWKKNEKTSSFLWAALDNHLTVRLCLCGIILLTIVSCKSEKEEEPQTNIDEKTVIDSTNTKLQKDNENYKKLIDICENVVGGLYE